jgi:hypothetical protein
VLKVRFGEEQRVTVAGKAFSHAFPGRGRAVDVGDERQSSRPLQVDRISAPCACAGDSRCNVSVAMVGKRMRGYRVVWHRPAGMGAADFGGGALVAGANLTGAILWGTSWCLGGKLDRPGGYLCLES